MTEGSVCVVALAQPSMLRWRKQLIHAIRLEQMPLRAYEDAAASLDQRVLALPLGQAAPRRSADDTRVRSRTPRSRRR